MSDAALYTDAFIYSFPIYEMARTRHLAMSHPLSPLQGKANRIAHRRVLADHTSRNVTTPNNDTLYSSAWLDLSDGPVLVRVPRIAGRYWSLQFLDAFTHNAAVVGSRNAAEGDLTLWVALASDPSQPPEGMRVLRLPTPDIWMLVRIEVRDNTDAKTVHPLQDALQVRALNAPPEFNDPSQPQSAAGLAAAQRERERPAPKPAQGLPTDPANYLAVVNHALARNGVPATEQSLLQRWRALGLGGDLKSAEVKVAAQGWSAHFERLGRDLRSDGFEHHRVQGWRYPKDTIGLYNGDYVLRAAVALGGLAALPVEEALYLGTDQDAQGQPLDPSAVYRVRIPPTGVDARAFWSITMYQWEPDGRSFFSNNPIGRYAIGDRTEGLIKNPDGSIDLTISRTEPSEPAARTNWLPAPPAGQNRMRLSLRAYLPGAALVAGKQPLPVITRVGP